MNIPTEAVETVARYLADFAGTGTNNWEWHIDGARELLEALIPRIQSVAWDEGMEAMYDSTSHEWPPVPERNPYRSQS